MLTPSISTLSCCEDGDVVIVGVAVIVGGEQLSGLRYGAMSIVPEVTP